MARYGWQSNKTMKVKTKYIPMPGSRISTTAAEKIGREIGRITKKHGCAKPEIVVDEASSPSNPLHTYFTWDDSEAAHQWRITEARQIIRSVRIVRSDMPAQEQPVVRAFMNVNASDMEQAFTGRGYIPMTRVLKSEDYKKQILNVAMSELREWQDRYADYKTYFDGVFSAIDEVADALKK